MKSRTIVVCFIAALLGSVVISIRSASAQVVFYPVPDVTLSAGYSNVQLERTKNLFYDHNGGYLDANIAWTVPLAVPLQAGLGISGSGYSDRQSIAVPQYANDYYYGYDDHLYSDLGLIEIEPRLGVRFGGQTGFFATPRFGGGLLINSYSVDEQFNNNGNSYIDTQHHSGAGFELRPAIQAGYNWGPVTLGVDASYMYCWGDFGDFGHHAQELRIGGFLKFVF